MGERDEQAKAEREKAEREKRERAERFVWTEKDVIVERPEKGEGAR